MPIISRKPSASITIVGFFSMKLASGVGGDQHHGDRDDDRDEHDRQVVGHADGGDDRVDREDEVEQQDLDDRAAERDGDRLADRCRPCGRPGSTVWWISLVAFQTRNRPPAIRIRSRQEKAWPKAVKTGAVMPTIQAIVASRTSRMISAAPMPIRRARCAVLGRQLVGQDRDEDQVVDAEHDLHGDQRHHRGPALRRGQEGEVGGYEIHGVLGAIRARRTSSRSSDAGTHARGMQAGTRDLARPGWHQASLKTSSRDFRIEGSTATARAAAATRSRPSDSGEVTKVSGLPSEMISA